MTLSPALNSPPPETVPPVCVFTTTLYVTGSGVVGAGVVGSGVVESGVVSEGSVTSSVLLVSAGSGVVSDVETDDSLDSVTGPLVEDGEVSFVVEFVPSGDEEADVSFGVSVGVFCAVVVSFLLVVSDCAVLSELVVDVDDSDVSEVDADVFVVAEADIAVVVVTSVVVDSSGTVSWVLVLIDADSAPENTDVEESEAFFFAHEDSAITRTNDN